jgi:hypothetical protein
VIWFFLWPMARGTGLWRRLAHAALTPFLVLAPLWMGYCVMSRTPWGPTGGVLYPWMVWLLQSVRMEENAGWERAFFRVMPKVFEPMSQGGDLVGIMYEPWGRAAYTTGPVEAAMGAVVVCAGVWVFWRWGELRRGEEGLRGARGFEVVGREGV